MVLLASPRSSPALPSRRPPASPSPPASPLLVSLGCFFLYLYILTLGSEQHRVRPLAHNRCFPTTAWSLFILLPPPTRNNTDVHHHPIGLLHLRRAQQHAGTNGISRPPARSISVLPPHHALPPYHLLRHHHALPLAHFFLSLNILISTPAKSHLNHNRTSPHVRIPLSHKHSSAVHLLRPPIPADLLSISRRLFLPHLHRATLDKLRQDFSTRTYLSLTQTFEHRAPTKASHHSKSLQYPETPIQNGQTHPQTALPRPDPNQESPLEEPSQKRCGLVSPHNDNSVCRFGACHFFALRWCRFYHGRRGRARG